MHAGRVLPVFKDRSRQGGWPSFEHLPCQSLRTREAREGRPSSFISEPKHLLFGKDCHQRPWDDDFAGVRCGDGLQRFEHSAQGLDLHN